MPFFLERQYSYTFAWKYIHLTYIIVYYTIKENYKCVTRSHELYSYFVMVR